MIGVPTASIDHVAITVSDLDQALAVFYQRPGL